MRKLLPRNTVVYVTPRPVIKPDGTVIPAERPYVAIVRGYDMYETMYNLGRRTYTEAMYTSGGTWVPVGSEVIALADYDREQMKVLHAGIAHAIDLLNVRKERHPHLVDWRMSELEYFLIRARMVAGWLRDGTDPQDPAVRAELRSSRFFGENGDQRPSKVPRETKPSDKESTG